MNDVTEGMVAELRAGAERLVADNTDHRRTRALRNTLPGFDETLYGTVVELGWLGILVPEAAGGLGLGLAEMTAVVRELEKGLLSGPLLETAVLGARTLVHADGAGGRADLLAQVATGACRPALALDFDSALPCVTATGEGGSYRLSGTCRSVAGAAAATGLVVPARAEDGWRLFWVEPGTAGLSLSYQWRADGTPLGEAKLEGVAVPAEAVLASPEAAERAVALALDETRIAAAAALLGIAEHALGMTLDYMRTRKQFDRPIGSFQALQHKAVDLFVQKELSVSVLELALRLAAGAEDDAALAMAAVRAKGRCSEAGLRITREAIQLHGAIGFTEEYDLGLYVKRALVLASWLGNASDQRRRFIELGGALA